MRIYHVDKDNSEIRWQGMHDRAPMHGTIRFDDGHFFVETGELLEGSANIDITSVHAEDDEGALREDVEALLKSPDVLDSGRYATAHYKFNEVIEAVEGTELKGMLSLKERVFHLTIPVDLSHDASSLRLSGRFDVERINPQLYDELTRQRDNDTNRLENIHVQISICALAET